MNLRIYIMVAALVCVGTWTGFEMGRAQGMRDGLKACLAQ